MALDLAMTVIPIVLSLMSLVVKMSYPLVNEEVTARVEFQIELHHMRRSKLSHIHPIYYQHPISERDFKF